MPIKNERIISRVPNNNRLLIDAIVSNDKKRIKFVLILLQNVPKYIP
jgi:hypothetical protein